jgi:hypothetical protein
MPDYYCTENFTCRIDNLKPAPETKKPVLTFQKKKEPAVSLLFINRLLRYVARWIAGPDEFMEQLKEQNAREKRFHTDFGNTSIKYLPRLKPDLKINPPKMKLAKPQPKSVVREHTKSMALLEPLKAKVEVSSPAKKVKSSKSRTSRQHHRPLYAADNFDYNLSQQPVLMAAKDGRIYETVSVNGYNYIVAGTRDTTFEATASTAEDYFVDVTVHTPNEIKAGETFLMYIVVQNKEKYVEYASTAVFDVNSDLRFDFVLNAMQPYETKTFTKYITLNEPGQMTWGNHIFTKVDGTVYQKTNIFYIDVISDGITISPEQLDMNLGDSYQFSATGSNLMWTAFGPCTTTQTGLLSSYGTGRCYLRASNGIDYSIAFIRVYDSGYTVTGTVTDMFSEDTLAGADIEVDGKTVTSDSNGDYSVSLSSPGYYETTVTKDGYTPFHTWITVKEGNDNEKDMILIPADFDWNLYNKVHRTHVKGRINELDLKFSTSHWKNQPDMIIFNDTSKIDPTNPYEDITKTLPTLKTNLETILPKYNPRDANPEKIFIEQEIRTIDGEFATYWDNDLLGVGVALFVFEGPVISSCASIFTGGVHKTEPNNWLYNQELGTCFGAIAEPYNINQESVFTDPTNVETYTKADYENVKVYLTRSRIHYRNGGAMNPIPPTLTLEDQDYEARPDIVEKYYGENALKSASMDKTFVYKDESGTHSYNYYEVPEDVKAMFPTMF